MIEIRDASELDVPLVQDLARRIWHVHYPGIISVEQIDYMLSHGYADDLLRTFLSSPGAGLALAQIDGVPAGFAAWMRSSDAETTKLDKLYVLPALQRTGVGRTLIRHVEAAARADRSTALVLNVNKRNATAIAAYVKSGFSVRREVVVDIGNGFVMDDFIMSKAL